MRAGLFCLLALVATAGCGRIGYEQVQLAERPVDAGADAAQDQPVVETPPADVGVADARDPDVADAQPDARGPDVADAQPDAPPDPYVTATYGRQSGTLYTDLCPPNDVLLGLEGSAGPLSGSIYDNLVGRCGRMNLTSSPPYRVTSASYSDPLPARGSGVVTFAQSCPAGQAMVGFEGRAGPDLRALSFICADLVVTGGPMTYTLVPGSDRSVQPLMNVAGGTPFSAACPPGQLARGTHLWAGPRIQAFGLACGTVSVRP